MLWFHALRVKFFANAAPACHAHVDVSFGFAAPFQFDAGANRGCRWPKQFPNRVVCLVILLRPIPHTGRSMDCVPWPFSLKLFARPCKRIAIASSPLHRDNTLAMSVGMSANRWSSVGISTVVTCPNGHL